MLRDARPRDALLDELRGVDRLVLLGDAVELRHGPHWDALARAAPVLEAIGDALGEARQIVLVPGNHDHHLLAPWLERRRRDDVKAPLGLENAVDSLPGEPLAQISNWLAPASLQVCYPGTWLREDVYVTHGHYLDRHTTVPMFERLGAGAMARIVGERGANPVTVEDYEAILAPLYAWIDELAQHGGPQLGSSSHGASSQAWRALAGRRSGRRTFRRRALIAGFPALIGALNRTPLGPLRADLSVSELRRAALRAFGEVLDRLAVPAEHVIFGHTHRAGPLDADDQAEWRTDGGVRLTNSGCWVQERAFLGPRPSESPYRAGFCVLVENEGDPRLTNALDGLIEPPA